MCCLVYTRRVIYATPARNTNANLPCAFRTYPANTNVIPDCPIWKALRASTAHPELLGSVEIEEFGAGFHFIDGSEGCSNPTALMLREAGVVFPHREIASIVSIGAGHPDTVQFPQSNWLERALTIGGSLTPQAWRASHGIAQNNERVAKDVAVRLMRVECDHYRLNVDTGVQISEPNEWERESEVADHTRRYVQLEEVDQRLSELVKAVQEKPKSLTTLELSQIGPKSPCSARCDILT